MYKRIIRYGILLYLLSLNVWLQATEVLVIDDPSSWSRSELSAYIGQTVRFSVPFYVVNNYSGLEVAPRRTYFPTHLDYPSTTTYNRLLSAESNAMVELTNYGSYHRIGERIVNLTARINSSSSMSYVSGTWVGNTREELESGYDAKAIDRDGEHTLLICSMNCEYYLTQCFGQGYGPDSEAEHQRQRAKISNALGIIDADIYGLVEVQQGQDALAEIAADLTQNTGRRFTYIDDGGSVDGTYTKSGYVYCSDVVKPYGDMKSNDSQVRNRKKMQCFVETKSGEKFIYSLNHFKAKSGSGTGLNADQGDGQGSYNAMRTKEAQSVLDQYAQCRSYYNDSDLLVMGDLNAYAKEDPIRTLTQYGLTDLHRYYHADSSYSYMYRGYAGYLDHALCNSTMLAQVTGMTAYHINSDESDMYTYDKSQDRTMFRCSDHDPVLVGLKLRKTGTQDKSVGINTYEVYYENATPCIRNANGGYYRLYMPSGLMIKEGKITSNAYAIEGLDQGLYIIHIYGQSQCLEAKILKR